MIRGLFGLLWRLLIFAVVVLLGTAVWIVYDGLNDTSGAADCAVVLGAAVRSDGQPGPALRERLDRAIELYRAKTVPVIIVSGADHIEGDGYSEAAGMASYLRAHEVPADAIIEDHKGVNTDATARDLAGIMESRHFHSVTIVTSYYHITRTKMALRHEGITGFTQAHAGTVRKEDAFSIAREVADIYYHLFKYYLSPYLAPAAEKATVTLKSEAEQLNSELQAEKKKVDQSLKKTPNP
jgi:vancomycin permeability regulator SanA